MLMLLAALTLEAAAQPNAPKAHQPPKGAPLRPPADIIAKFPDQTTTLLQQIEQLPQLISQ
jgi:hypothetical protein